jgi:hypothetical protein
MDDPENCGSCGHLCDVGAACVGGTCMCAGNLHCTGVCTQTSGAGDPGNCGACGSPCLDTQVCTGGTCTCRYPWTPCGATCVDTETDPQNCGACGTKCAMEEVCVSPKASMPGACMAQGATTPCPLNYKSCGTGSCVLLTSFLGDPANCGSCGNVCARDEVCTALGTCQKYFASPSCTQCPCEACGSGHTCCPMGGVPLCVAGAACGF